MIETICSCGLPVDEHPEVIEDRTTFDDGFLAFYRLCDGLVETAIPT